MKVMGNEGNWISRGKFLVKVCVHSELVVSITISFSQHVEGYGYLNHFDCDKHDLKDVLPDKFLQIL